MSAQLIEVPKVPDVGRSWLGSTRVTRTNALPKQSLFGTTLQQKEGNVIEGIRNVNLKQEDGAKSSRSTKSKILSAELEAIFGEGKLEYIKILFVWIQLILQLLSLSIICRTFPFPISSYSCVYI